MINDIKIKRTDTKKQDEQDEDFEITKQENHLLISFFTPKNNDGRQKMIKEILEKLNKDYKDFLSGESAEKKLRECLEWHSVEGFDKIKKAILKAAFKSQGNMKEAANLLKIDPKTLSSYLCNE